MTIMCERLTSVDEEQFITGIQQQLQFIPEAAETEVSTLCVHVRSKTDCGFDIVKQIVIPTVICIVVITIFVINGIDTFSNYGLGRCFRSSPAGVRAKGGDGIVVQLGRGGG